MTTPPTRAADDSATTRPRPPAVARVFRWVAVVEALSWLALIVATLIKYTTDPQMEGGVKVLGPVHGGLFTLYVVLALVVAWKLGWGVRTLAVVLVDSVVPTGGFLVARRPDLRWTAARPRRSA